MNMKDAFRFQNKLKALMCEATAILEDRRNIVKVKTTHLRSKVMSDTQDAVVEEAAPSEYAGHANEVAAFLMSGRNCARLSTPPRTHWIWIWTARWA